MTAAFRLWERTVNAEPATYELHTVIDAPLEEFIPYV